MNIVQNYIAPALFALVLVLVVYFAVKMGEESDRYFFDRCVAECEHAQDAGAIESEDLKSCKHGCYLRNIKPKEGRR
jgi:hypothetical protein